MELRDVLLLAHRLLDEMGIDHAVIGALAMANHGVQRATMDVDLLVDGSRASDARQALEQGGFVLYEESPDILQFEGIAALDLLLARREPTLAMLARAGMFGELGIKCVGPEDIIGLKIQAYVNDRRRRLQDQADIVSLMRTNAGLDWELVRKYAELFGEWDTIQALRQESGR